MQSVARNLVLVFPHLHLFTLVLVLEPEGFVLYMLLGLQQAWPGEGVGRDTELAETPSRASPHIGHTLSMRPAFASPRDLAPTHVCTRLHYPVRT